MTNISTAIGLVLLLHSIGRSYGSSMEVDTDSPPTKSVVDERFLQAFQSTGRTRIKGTSGTAGRNGVNAPNYLLPTTSDQAEYGYPNMKYGQANSANDVQYGYPAISYDKNALPPRFGYAPDAKSLAGKKSKKKFSGPLPIQPNNKYGYIAERPSYNYGYVDSRISSSKSKSLSSLARPNCDSYGKGRRGKRKQHYAVYDYQNGYYDPYGHYTKSGKSKDKTGIDNSDAYYYYGNQGNQGNQATYFDTNAGTIFDSGYDDDATKKSGKRRQLGKSKKATYSNGILYDTSKGIYVDQSYYDSYQSGPYGSSQLYLGPRANGAGPSDRTQSYPKPAASTGDIIYDTNKGIYEDKDYYYSTYYSDHIPPKKGKKSGTGKLSSSYYYGGIYQPGAYDGYYYGDPYYSGTAGKSGKVKSSKSQKHTYYYYREEECEETYSPAPTYTPLPTVTAFPTEYTGPTMALKPTQRPTGAPTKAPTVSPTESPTRSPTMSPTESPTTSPTRRPTVSPTMTPTVTPTMTPTMTPTVNPTMNPTISPTMAPTITPTLSPTKQSSPTMPPSKSSAPTPMQTSNPTTAPTGVPTAAPTGPPTTGPTLQMSTTAPTSLPTTGPTPGTTTATPTTTPTAVNSPTSTPTAAVSPTIHPTMVPTPTESPSVMPTAMPNPLVVRTPFNLQYTLQPPDTVPSQSDINTLQNLTQKFLEQVFRLKYDFTTNTTLDSLQLKPVTSVDQNGTVSVDWEATATFSPDSTVVPTQNEVNALVNSAFQGMNSAVYMDLLSGTGSNNAFSSTTGFTKQDSFQNPGSQSMLQRTTARSENLSGKQVIGVIGAGAIVLVGTAVMYYGGRKRRKADHLRRVSLTI